MHSTWQVDPEDLLELSDGVPRIILTVLWPIRVGCSISVGDEPSHADVSLDAEYARDDDVGYWRYILMLSGRELQVLRDGARIQIMVDLTPPPPVSLQLA